VARAQVFEGLAQGPSSSQTNYLQSTAPGWTATAILSVGDTAQNGYQMVGVPDGLGAFDNGNGTITVLMNHELGGDPLPAQGVARGSGAAGSFVSQWVIDKKTLQVISGRDFIATPSALHIDPASTNQSTTLARLCSADLPALSAFYNAASGKGYNGLIFMNGEENGPPFSTNGQQGRTFGWVVAENAGYSLPKLGEFSRENAVASPNSGDKTVVMGQQDATPGSAQNIGSKVFVYVGDKQATGTAIERAGLTNGTNYAIQVGNVGLESRTANIGLSKTLVGTGGTAFSLVQADGTTLTGGTNFLRPEDGAWDTQNPNRYYFVTTDRLDTVKDGVGAQVGRSRLYAVTFTDVTNPLLGGTIEMLLDGTEAQNMFDNITVDADGNIYLQEDTGNAAHNAKVWKFDLKTGTLTQLFQHDPSRFGGIGIAATAPYNVDEESSGILDVSALFQDVPGYNGQRVLLADVQAHYSLGGALVEGGQLLLLVNPVPEPASIAAFGAGLAGLAAVRRRRKARG